MVFVADLLCEVNALNPQIRLKIKLNPGDKKSEQHHQRHNPNRLKIDALVVIQISLKRSMYHSYA
jgi:hypothetical protein